MDLSNVVSNECGPDRFLCSSQTKVCKKLEVQNLPATEAHSTPRGKSAGFPNSKTAKK